MLFLIIERFKPEALTLIAERFKSRGRMLPTGIALDASWMRADGDGCYLLLQASSQELIDTWIVNWSDLIEFEVVKVENSADFWANWGDLQAKSE